MHTFMPQFGDWADSARASEEFDYDQVDEHLDGPMESPELMQVMAEKLEFGRRLVDWICGSDRCRLAVDCLYLALGDGVVEGVRASHVAERHQITPAAVSKRLSKIHDELALPRPPISAPVAEKLDFGRRLVSYIRASDRSRLTAHCLRLALGDTAVEANGVSRVAANYGITKAAVSKRSKKIRRELHLPRTHLNKSETACSTYRRTNVSRPNLEAAYSG